MNADYKEYCSSENKTSVQLNQYGNVQEAIAKESRDAYPQMPAATIEIDEPKQKINEMKEILRNHAASDPEYVFAKKILGFLSREETLHSFPGNREIQDAKQFILKKSRSHHFLLINEAHYSSQHREFTKSLLKDLWALGYRYLALETLSHEDPNLNDRGYPLYATGFYTRDPVFGNLVRTAISLGYTLIPYETTIEVNGRLVDGTPRDTEQARNIYNNTIKKDPAGKVIIHAGYSHISEFGGDSYKPMGAQLKELYGDDILTIDQVKMTGLFDSTKMNPFYVKAIHDLDVEEPIVVLENGEAFIDPIEAGSVDIQVFHPMTKFIQERPSWLVNNSNHVYSLDDQFDQFTGSLLQIFPLHENESSTPVDQIIIQRGKAIILEPGKYVAKIFDCNGSLIGTCDVEAN